MKNKTLTLTSTTQIGQTKIYYIDHIRPHFQTQYKLTTHEQLQPYITSVNGLLLNHVCDSITYK